MVTVNLNGNTGPGGVLNFLSNPPAFRISQEAATSCGSGTITAVPFTGITPTVDSYSGWSTASATYAVQRTGLYLAHGLTCFSANATGARMAAFAITPSGSASATYYWGPPAAGTAVLGTHTGKTQILDLAAGDTIGLAGYQTSGGSLNLSTASQTRFLLAWLGELGTPAGTWSPPDTTFRWQSGTKPTSDGGNLTEQFQQHLGNDLGFLVNRPYFTGYQNVAQSSVAANAYTTLVLNKASGYIHGGSGDNYTGWSSGSNTYTAQAAGWYLFCCESFTSAPAITGCPVITAALIATSGGVTPSQSPDVYQQNVAPTTFGGGAAALGVAYLDVGETIAFQVQGAGFTAAYQTIVGLRSGGYTNSHAEICWLSE